MAQLIQVEDCNAYTPMGGHYEKLLASIGSEDFGKDVRDAIMSSAGGARRLYLFEATSRDDNDLHYSFCEPEVAALFPAYTKLYQPLDPICDVYNHVSRKSSLAIFRVRPSDICSTSFRRQFYDEPAILERLSIIQRGGDSWRVMSVSRHRSEGYFSDDEVGAILSLACLALPMLPLNRERRRQPQRLSVSQLEERFLARHPLLTRREGQVCARASLGMTVEATALDLGIAKSSVLTYRKRAYHRLGVTSPFELCALVTH